jgi:hypothetical protein
VVDQTADPSPVQTDDDQSQRGAVVILTTLLLIVFMGMAALAIDLGWLYYNQLNTRKAAEAAALAGVVHMPLPGCIDPGPLDEPTTVARDIARQQGYQHNFGGVTVATAKGTNCNQLEVDIARTYGTFFLQVFGVDQVEINQAATAEYLPPLKLGSDESYLGEDPLTSGRNRDFFVAINGTRRRKGSGDPFATKCAGTGTSHNCPDTGANIGVEFSSPAYYYAVEVEPADNTRQLNVQIFDGHHCNMQGGTLTPDATCAATDTQEYDGGADYQLTFRLYAPDSTPADWTDNSSNGPALCSRTFRYQPDEVGQWHSLNNCPISAVSGIYVLEVDMIEATPALGDNNISVSAFSIRATIDGNLDNSAAVYGLGAMSLWMPEFGSDPRFKIVRLDEIYAGSELVLSMFDSGDVDGTIDLDFTGELAGQDCLYRVRDEFLNEIQAWGPDDGGAGCYLSITNKEYNNEWIDFRFTIDPGYSCSGDCWVYVDYDLTGVTDAYERTTWAARVDGQPIHLVP